MSILHVAQCEMYEECNRRFPIDIDMDPLSGHVIVPPRGWKTLCLGDPYKDAPLHFCSALCLAKWSLTHMAWGDDAKPENFALLAKLNSDNALKCGAPSPKRKQCGCDFDYINVVYKPLPDGTLQSLASGTIYKPVVDVQPCKARRFLLVNEDADIEGIKWGNGCVSIIYNGDAIRTYPTWDALKEDNDGSGIQWVD